MRSRWTHLQNARGFTIVELMTTLFLAFIITSAVYTMYDQSSRAYQTQFQFTEAHRQLRFSLDHIRSDIRRAAFQATPNHLTDPRVCWTPPGSNLRALHLQQNLGFVFDPATNVHINPSALTLFGDYFAPNGHAFQATQIDSGGNVFLDTTDPVVQGLSEEDFLAIFRPGVRWLRVTTRDEKDWYAPVGSVDYGNRRITLAEAPPVTGYCVSSFGAGEISPVGWVRYRLVQDTRSEALLGDGGAARMVGKTDLIREEVSSNGVAVAGTALVIGENVVDLAFYDFGFDTSSPGQASLITTQPFIENVVNGDGSGALGATDITATPERLRFFTVKLSVRTVYEEYEVDFVPRQSEHGPFRTFELDPTLEGATRVESSASRVDLRNIALRRLNG